MEGIKEPESGLAPSKEENGYENKSAADLLEYVCIRPLTTTLSQPVPLILIRHQDPNRQKRMTLTL